MRSWKQKTKSDVFCTCYCELAWERCEYVDIVNITPARLVLWCVHGVWRQLRQSQKLRMVVKWKSKWKDEQHAPACTQEHEMNESNKQMKGSNNNTSWQVLQKTLLSETMRRKPMQKRRNSMWALWNNWKSRKRTWQRIELHSCIRESNAMDKKDGDTPQDNTGHFSGV